MTSQNRYITTALLNKCSLVTMHPECHIIFENEPSSDKYNYINHGKMIMTGLGGHISGAKS